jgi:aspartyl-tRNA(Asn)/glutamyl-tRNA(Gln) amidotransferase subunit A
MDASRRAADRFASVDVIASPTLMLSPDVMNAGQTSDKFWARNRGIVHNTVPVNYLGLCAVTLPIGLDKLGLPVGLQFIAKGGDDEKLIAIACAAERALGTPRDRLGPPPMCKA